MKRNITVLDNGLRVCITKEACKKVGCAAAFRAGTVYERGGERGITHMAEHMMFRRLGGTPQRELYMQTRRMGTNMRGSTYRDMLYFGISACKGELDNQLKLIGSIFQTPQWTQSDFVQERKVVLKQISNRYYGQIERYVFEKYMPENIGGYIMGGQSDVEALTLEQLMRFHREMISTENACAVIYGDLSKDDITNALRQLESIKPAEKEAKTWDDNAAVIFGGAEAGRKAGVQYCAGDGYAADLEILLGFDGAYARSAELLSAALGMGDGAELAMQLRENDAITDDADSYVEKSGNFAYMSINAYVQNKYLSEALSRINGTLCDIRERWDRNTFQKHRDYLEAWTRLNCAGDPHQECLTAARNGFILQEGVFGIDELAGAYRDIRYEDFCAFTQKTIRGDNLQTVLSGAERTICSKKVQGQVEALRRL